MCTANVTLVTAFLIISVGSLARKFTLNILVQIGGFSTLGFLGASEIRHRLSELLTTGYVRCFLDCRPPNSQGWCFDSVGAMSGWVAQLGHFRVA